MKAKRSVCSVLLVTLMSFLFCGSVATTAENPADWAPADALFFVQMNDINLLRDKIKKTNSWGMYTEEAMQPFIRQIMEEVDKKLAEGMKDFWKEIGLSEAPEQIPWPQGKIVAIGFVQPRMMKVADDQEMAAPDFQVVGLVDLGDNIDIARKISLNITQKAAEEGLVRDLQTVRDVPITILKKSQESDADFDTFCYGFMDNQLILGSSLKYIRQTLMLIDGVAMPQLSNNENFISMNQALGSADLRGYLNVKRLLDVIRNTMPPEGLSPFNRQMATMGIDNIEGVGMTMQLMPERNIQLKSKVLVSIKGEKKGIPALMVPASSPVRPNRMLKKGLASFMTANYDMGTLYDGITKIAWSISGMNPAPMIQGAMMATGGPQGSNPVNFREEFIGQLVKPLTVGVGFEKPYTASDSMKLFMSIGVKDGEVLDKALARIHSTFLAPGQKEMQRELLNSTLYLLPNPFAMMLAAQAGQLSNAQNSFLAMAVVGDQLVFSTDKAVEQTIRDLRRSDIETMATDPMYQYASGYLPEMAGIYFYGNSQISTEKDWVILKEAAKKMAENPNDSDDTMIPLIPFGGSAMMTSLVKEMREIIDFNLLPDFEVVQKYFGPTVGYVSNRDDGIYVEFINLTAPGK